MADRFKSTIDLMNEFDYTETGEVQVDNINETCRDTAYVAFNSDLMTDEIALQNGLRSLLQSRQHFIQALRSDNG